MNKSLKTATNATPFDYSLLVTSAGKLDIQAKAELIACQQEFLMSSKQANCSLVLCGVHLRNAKDILSIQGRNGMFTKWISAEVNIGRSSAYRYIELAKVFSPLIRNLKDNTLKMFTVGALHALSRASVPEDARKESLKLATSAEIVDEKTVAELIAKHTIESEAKVPGLSRSVRNLVSSGKLRATDDQLSELACYDTKSQQSLAQNVVDGRQGISDAIRTGDIVVPTPEEAMKEHNKAIESIARKFAEIASEFNSPWLNKSAMTAIADCARTAAATARLGKGLGVCPKCNGDKCKVCRQTGFLPKIEMEMHRE